MSLKMENKMDLVKWNKRYLNNQRLDQIFNDKYQNDDKIYQKNVIEFLVELGEFVNETKVFKYWSIKKSKKDKVLEEYADTMTMCLYFMREFKEELDDRYCYQQTEDILEVINDLYRKITLLMQK